jgi:hypothetical protein
MKQETSFSARGFLPADLFFLAVNSYWSFFFKVAKYVEPVWILESLVQRAQHIRRKGEGRQVELKSSETSGPRNCTRGISRTLDFNNVALLDSNFKAVALVEKNHLTATRIVL